MEKGISAPNIHTVRAILYYMQFACLYMYVQYDSNTHNVVLLTLFCQSSREPV